MIDPLVIMVIKAYIGMGGIDSPYPPHINLQSHSYHDNPFLATTLAIYGILKIPLNPLKDAIHLW